MWILIVGSSVVIAVVRLLRPKDADLGTVSAEWLAQHRQATES
jgi:hypothetical protein